MSVPVFDLFTLTQNDNGTTVTNNASFGPGVNSLRSITWSNSDSSVINGGTWTTNISSSEGDTVVITYVYNPNSQPIINDMISLPFIGSIPTGVNTVELRVRDNASPPNFAQVSIPLATTNTWLLNTTGGFTGVNLSNINSLVVLLNIAVGSTGTFTFGPLSSVVTCLVADTNILLHDGKTKLIQNIQRGDIVAGDQQITTIHKVAHVNTMSIHPDVLIDVYEFAVNSIELNIPNKNLIITPNHPIVYQDARRPAKCFRHCPLVETYSNIPANIILPVNYNDEYILYDLQFDHDGTYVANGVTVQSRSPYSDLTPLPHSSYFDLSNYRSDLTWDSHNQLLPLINELL